MPSDSPSDLEAFRAEVRAFLEEHCPATMRGPIDLMATANWGGRRREFFEPREDGERWMHVMAERGFTVPTWPKEYGGGGLSTAQARVLAQEMARIEARPPHTNIGITMLGPTLLEFGTEEQKREHVPKIARGEIRWCQGYSEPGAGSDLASLQTRCEDRGDHYVLNGQKIWTSYADKSDWIFCLVRSDPKASKHEGISFVLVDMDQPGVRTSPIKLISGSSPFCQTFFENARVEKRDLVGKPGQGWTIGKRLLQFERQSISGVGAPRAQRAVSLGELGKRYLGDDGGRVADARLREAIAHVEIEQRALGATVRRSQDEARAGGEVGTASSIFKYVATETNKARHELALEILGSQGLGWEGDGFDADELALTRQWLRSKANSIEGGSSEIQLNIIAKRVLGLPD
ncbi:MAG: acyl-CoA dehydrogenase family protein [Myxococcota bacterium]|nr:acyl-CoA dehydrogenase family protein [Myxococcales bacterium]